MENRIIKFFDQIARWRWEHVENNKLWQRLSIAWSQAYWRWQLGRFGTNSFIYPFVAIHSSRLVFVGNQVNIAEFVHIWGAGRVEIGDNTIIASHTVISSQTHDKYAPIFRESNIFKPVKIGKNCWIGSHAVILPGVKIGDGSIIGAGAIVTHNIPPRSIAVGVPAKVVENLPPPHGVKERIVKNYAKKYNAKVLVETGTYEGEMIDAVLNNFKKIYSIELDKTLYKDAMKKYLKINKIKLFQGDSSLVLKKFLKKIPALSIFWLDAHYSGGKTARGKKETPVTDELKIILSSGITHILLIDDARLFGVRTGYPSLKKITGLASKNNYRMDVKDDIIRLTPEIK